MNFNEFDIEMAGADINADVEYYSPTIVPDYVNTKTEITDSSQVKYSMMIQQILFQKL